MLSPHMPAPSSEAAAPLYLLLPSLDHPHSPGPASHSPCLPSLQHIVTFCSPESPHLAVGPWSVGLALPTLCMPHPAWPRVWPPADSNSVTELS